MTLLLDSTSSGDKVGWALSFRAGEEFDPQDRPGLARLALYSFILSATALEPARSFEQWQKEYESRCRALVGRDFMVVTGLVGADQWASELDQLATRATAIHVTAEVLETARERVASDQADLYSSIALTALVNHGANAIDPLPGARARGASLDALASISPEEVSTWIRRHYRLSEATISIVGRFDLEPTRQTLKKWLDRSESEPRPIAAESPARSLEFRTQAFTGNSRYHGPAYVAARTWRMPEPSHPHYAAAVLFGKRLAQWNIEAGKANLQGGLYAPLDADRTFTVMVPATSGDPEQARTVLDEICDRIFGWPLDEGEAERVEKLYAPLFAFHRPPDAVVAASAMGIAYTALRRHQIGIDTVALRSKVASLTEEDRKRAVSEWFDKSMAVDVLLVPE